MTHYNNKNAYEIRLDVLQMAHSDEQMRFLENLNVRRLKSNGEFVNPSDELINELFPKPSNIIARAEELYKFVEGKGGL